MLLAVVYASLPTVRDEINAGVKVLAVAVMNAICCCVCWYIRYCRRRYRHDIDASYHNQGFHYDDVIVGVGVGRLEKTQV